jgi:hypothetical protein
VKHAQQVQQFLIKLQQHNLYLKPEKCTFHQQTVEYLGVVISQGTISMDPVKVQGITDWPPPMKVKEVRSFLGFCNFYQSFIPKFSDVTRPLNDLTKKNQQWRWTYKEQQAFDTLKHLCQMQPVLRMPD